MPAEVVDNPAEHRFEISLDGEAAGFTEYRPHGDALEFFHTVIGEAFEGKGLGSILIGSTLDAIRERGVKIVPTCTFVRGYIDKHPEYADLIA
jgi:predicted GNAT family acetyltransferase